jgi:hypothetical protein
MKAYEWALGMKDGVSSVMAKLSGNADKATAQFSTLQNKVDTFSHRVRSSGSSVDFLEGKLRGLRNLALGLFAGISLGAFAMSSVHAYDEQAKADAQLRASIVSTRGIAGQTFEMLSKQAGDLQKVTLFPDEQINAAQKQLLKFTNVRSDVFTKTIPVVLDIAAKDGSSPEAVAEMLGKGLQNPASGLMLINRQFKLFTEAQTKGLQQAAAAGHVHEVQMTVLTELNKKFGGSAAAAAAAGIGPIQQLKIQWDDFKEEVGKTIIDFVNKHKPQIEEFMESLKNAIRVLMEKLMAAFSWIEEHWTVVKYLGLFVGIIWSIVKVTQAWTAVQAAFNVIMAMNPIALVIVSIAALITGVVLLWNRFAGFRAFLFGLWESFKTIFKSIKDIAVSVLGGIGQLLVGVFTFNVSKITAGLSSLKEGFGKASELGMKTAVSFATGYDKGIQNFQQGKKNTATAQQTTEDAYSKMMSGLPTGAKPSEDLYSKMMSNSPGGAKPTEPAADIKSGIDNISAGGNKVLNVHFDALVKDGIHVHSNTVKEGATDAASTMQEMLVRVLRGSELILSNE